MYRHSRLTQFLYKSVCNRNGAFVVHFTDLELVKCMMAWWNYDAVSFVSAAKHLSLGFKMVAAFGWNTYMKYHNMELVP